MPHSDVFDNWLRDQRRQARKLKKAEGVDGKRKVIPRNFSGPAPLPATSTNEPPSSPGKVLVMQLRALRGEQLFHPDDAKLDQRRKPAALRLLSESIMGGMDDAEEFGEEMEEEYLSETA